MLLDGVHQSPEWPELFLKIGRVDLFACFQGDPMGNPQLCPVEVQIGQNVLPVFTHIEIVQSNMLMPPGAWVDEIGIRQAACDALNKGLAGVYVNFRSNGWLFSGELLTAASLGHLPAA